VAEPVRLNVKAARAAWLAACTRAGCQMQTAMIGRMPYTTMRNVIFAHPTMAEGLTFLAAMQHPPQRVEVSPDTRGGGFSHVARGLNRCYPEPGQAIVSSRSS
jgi:hypothetical protein